MSKKLSTEAPGEDISQSNSTSSTSSSTSTRSSKGTKKIILRSVSRSSSKRIPRPDSAQSSPKDSNIHTKYNRFDDVSDLVLNQKSQGKGLDSERKKSLESDRKKDEKEITININTIMGKYIPITVLPSNNVGHVKEKIAEIEGVSPFSQMLVFAGQQLTDDSKDLKSLRIQDQSNIQLVLKMAGGKCLFDYDSYR